MSDRFSDGQVEQLEGIIRRVVRPIVREEIRSEVATQLKPINDKLDQIIETEREDTDSITSIVIQHDQEIKLIKRHVGLPVSV